MRLSSRGRFAILVTAVLAVGIVALGPSAGAARLVAIHELPEGSMCLWPESAAPSEESRLAELQGRQLAMLRQGLTPQVLFAAFQEPEGRAGRGRGQGQGQGQGRGQGRGQRQPPAPPLREIARQPAPRVLGDTFPTFTAVGVNAQTNEVIIQDNNLWSTWIFNRLENTPPTAPSSKPKRIIQGEQTHIQFNNGVYVDPKNGDIYSVESDTGDRMVVFSHDAGGNLAPKRLLNSPHRAYSIAVDEAREELYMTIEYPAEIVVYRKTAQGDEPPLRRIAGPRTRLEAPHGIAIDEKNQLLFVNHWGQAADFQNPGTGRFNDPGINVYPLNASGDVAPIRVIEGSRTQLNWPGNMALDRETGDLYVANDMGHSVLVFTGVGFVRGNVPPTRVIKGDRTALSYPTGVAVDAKNQELWVSNLGNASAVAFPLKATGNVAPLRVVRAAPLAHKSLTFGRTAAVAYDTNRHEILVPN